MEYKDINIFIQSDLPENEIVSCLTAFMGIEPKMGVNGFDQPICCWDLCCITFRFGKEHGFENDCGMDFESFEYECWLGPSMWSGLNEEADGLAKGMALMLGKYLSLKLKCRVMVVNNVQTLMAEYNAS
ncbi:MAG TPA: hypothetical protein VMF06_22640 [Candidatus Limnocylindria bacterium]|jgi:hypothetical protein|nr:hypothetical protein [Candidatus Limnocylindria bacterium]